MKSVFYWVKTNNLYIVQCINIDTTYCGVKPNKMQLSLDLEGELIMRTTWNCEICNESFNTETACILHESTCKKIETRTCSKCEKTESWELDPNNRYEYDWKSEEWFTCNFGRMGYGSCFDGCEVEFTLCEQCMKELIDSFTIEAQEHIHNSGSNRYCDSELWIKYHKGELTDEEIENETPWLSPRQIKAYEEKFHTCDNVVNNIYEDGSSGHHCLLHFAYEHQPSSDCYNCADYKKRNGEIKDIHVYID